MSNTKTKKPSSMLKDGVSLIQSRTGGYECVWKYHDHYWKRKYVQFHIISVNGEPADWVGSYKKYEIPGWNGKKFLDTHIIVNRSTFNKLVECGAYKVIQY
jgi:hypothetical protein